MNFALQPALQEEEEEEEGRRMRRERRSRRGGEERGGAATAGEQGAQMCRGSKACQKALRPVLSIEIC